MPLESLLELVETLRARIDEHSAALRQSEALTRYTLIDPLLRELGWDTTDPALVMPEYRSSAGFADYALMANGSQTPALIIEAKKLGDPLDDKVALQSLNYCNLIGTPYFALTDGQTWKIYSTFEHAPLSDRLIVTFSVGVMATAEVCLQALALWRPSVAGGSVSAGQAPVIGFEDTTRASSVIPAQPTTEMPTISEPAPQPRHAEPSSAARWIPLSDLSPKGGDTPPVEIQLPDNSRATLGRWSLVVVESARWLYLNNYLNARNCRVERGQRYIISASPIHPSGKEFTASRKIGSLYVELNYNGLNLVENARRVIQHAGLNPADFKMRFDYQTAQSGTSESALAAVHRTDSDKSIWTPLSDFQPEQGAPSTVEILFPDNSAVQLAERQWFRVTTETVRWLWENEHLNASNCRVQRSSRYIVSDSPIHPNGNRFISEKASGPFYVEASYSNHDYVKNAQIVIEHAGIDPTQFKIRLR